MFPTSCKGAPPQSQSAIQGRSGMSYTRWHRRFKFLHPPTWPNGDLSRVFLAQASTTMLF
eukprot:1372941-Rhodomonas_salina.2